MKRLQPIFLLILLLFSGSLYADQDFQIVPNYDTYGGINYKQNWLKPKGDWESIFVKYQPGFDVYFGWRFHPNFATELGFEWTADKHHINSIPNGASILGLRNNTGTTVSTSGRVRFKNAHAELNAFIPFSLGGETHPEWILSAGASLMKPQMKITTSSQNAFTNNFTPIQGRHQVIYRVGFGLQSILIESVGIRALWRFENTAGLRGRNSPLTENKNTKEIFKNSSSLALGLFLKF